MLQNATNCSSWVDLWFILGIPKTLKLMQQTNANAYVNYLEPVFFWTDCFMAEYCLLAEILGKLHELSAKVFCFLWNTWHSGSQIPIYEESRSIKSCLRWVSNMTSEVHVFWITMKVGLGIQQPQQFHQLPQKTWEVMLF